MAIEAGQPSKQLILEMDGLEEKYTEKKEVNTEPLQIERELQRANRALETVSACHKVLVRSKEKSELLKEVCRAIVDVGGYRMAWVGIAKDDKVKTIQPVGHAGFVDGYLDSRKISWDGDENGLGPEGQAVRIGKPYVVKNILADPDIMPWRGEALKRGYASAVALPLVSKGGTFGMLSIYSEEPDIFTSDEVNLLKDLTDNLVYGIVALHTRTERIRAESEVKKSLNKLRKALGAIIQVLEQTVEIRDPYTAGHQRRVADLACTVAEEMGLSDDRIDGIRIAGIIHDIGKIYVPAEILSKPRRLSQIEFNLIKTHPQVGFDVLKAIDFPWPVAKIILQHHERLDGSGYPHNLSAGDILLEAKILGVADVVEAMASHRPYRPSLGVDEALKEISKNKGILYEPVVVDACSQVFEESRFEFKDVTFEF